MPTKKELQDHLEAVCEELEQLREEKGERISIENCNIDMSSVEETKLEVAKAVRAGMEALKELGGPTYGIYIESRKDEEY